MVSLVIAEARQDLEALYSPLEVLGTLPLSPKSQESTRVIFLDIDGVLCCNHEMRLEHEKMLLLQVGLVRTSA